MILTEIISKGANCRLEKIKLFIGSKMNSTGKVDLWYILLFNVLLCYIDFDFILIFIII